MSDLTYISFGAGTQSTALLSCSVLGLHGVPRADVAIFADTGDEPLSTLETFRFYQSWASEHGLEVVRVSAGVLSEDIGKLMRGDISWAATIPAFARNLDGRAGPIKRKCTRHYKIDPIHREVRRRLGLSHGERCKKTARCLLGISRDEVVRMKPSLVPWIENCWPLVDANLSRLDCVRVIEELGLPKPSRSACVYCPYHDDVEWARMRDDDPEAFGRAVEMDRLIRPAQVAGLKEGELFLHKSMKPLDEVEFGNWKTPGQLPLFTEECEGVCGV